MSHFSTALRALMTLADPPLTQVDLAQATGYSQATISRLLEGREPAIEQVGKLCAAISPDRARRLELLLADLRDRAAAGQIAGIDERHFLLAPVADEAQGTITVAGNLAAELKLIADECTQHDDFRGLVSDLAHLITRHRAELTDAAAGVYPFPSLKRSEAAEDIGGQALDDEKKRRRSSKSAS